MKRATRPAEFPARGPSTEISRGSMVRHLQPGEELLAADRVADHHGQVQREPGDVREGVGRVHGQRGEDREDLVDEPAVQLVAGRASSSSSQPTSRICSFSRAGRICSAKTSAWRSCSGVRRRTAAFPAGRWGSCPAAEGTARPVAMRRLSPATRTMKNSSRFEAKIERKLTRSSSVQLRILGQLQHPGVEVQPAQLPVKEPVVGEVAVGDRGGLEVGNLDPVLGGPGRRDVGDAQGGGGWVRIHGCCP